MMLCPTCAGYGAIVIGPHDPIFGDDMEPCLTCDGSGSIGNEPDPCEETYPPDLC